MDEMKIKISTKFMRGIIAKIAAKVISKKLGFKPVIDLKELQLEKVGNKIRLHINVDAEVTDSDLLKITRLADLADDE